MSKMIRVELTKPQAYALLAAIAELTAGEMDGWNDTAAAVLSRARAKIIDALP